MADEFVIAYSREFQRFGSATIRAQLQQRGKHDELPMKVKDITVTPADIIDVAPDPSSTDTVAVFTAQLAKAIEQDEHVLDRLAQPVLVQITVTPVAEVTASLISADPIDVTQRCDVRFDTSQRISECDELEARFERLIERRLRDRDQLTKGVDVLRQAFRNQQEMERQYAKLETQHTEALAYLGAAGTVALIALGAVAASAVAYARTVTTAVQLFGSAEVTAEYMQIIYGWSPELATKAVQVASRAIVTNYATAAGAGTGAAATAGALATIREKMNAGLTEAQSAMASAQRMCDQLRQVCEDKKLELGDLARDITFTRSRMRGCPGVEVLPEPEWDIGIPTAVQWGIQG